MNDDRKPTAPMTLGPGMVCANHRNGISGTADRLPPARRHGSGDAYGLPSRFGNTLVYPDGRRESANRSAP